MPHNALAVSIDAAAGLVSWSAEGTGLRAAPGADFWRLFLDDGYEREIEVKSSLQRGVSSPAEGGEDIVYEGLRSVDGRAFDLMLTVHLRRREDGIELWGDVENRCDARVNELQLPFVDLAELCRKERSEDVLYRANGLGERMPDPWKALEKGHTEYMAADYEEIWSPLHYPRPSNMAWEGVESGGRFLYVGRHDARHRSCSINAGISPRNAPPRLILAISHYPLARKGETVEGSRCLVGLYEGDWRAGSDLYGAWARGEFYVPPEKPEWVRNFTGWQRVILRHQYGESFWKYSDLPRLYREGARYGLDVLMVFGWWKGRFDNGYPLYEADEALGGEEGLRKAIEEIRAEGGRVILYTNGILMDLKSDFYREVGHRVSCKDIDGNEYIDHYRFANNGTVLRTFGYKSFALGCMSTREWKERLLRNGRVKLSFGPDSIFYDQIGGHHSWLCFDETHEHGPRGDLDPAYRRKVFAALRELCSGGQALGTEDTVDLFDPYVDYHHGCDFGNWYAPGAFPWLFRRTFPETIMTNRFIHDCRSDYKLQLNWAFVMGYRFDVSIYRGRKVGIAGEPEYAERVKKLIALREEYRRFFYEGALVVETTPKLPAQVVMAEYRHGEERLFAFLNKGKERVELEVLGRKVAVGGEDVACVVV